MLQKLVPWDSATEPDLVAIATIISDWREGITLPPNQTPASQQRASKKARPAEVNTESTPRPLQVPQPVFTAVPCSVPLPHPQPRLVMHGPHQGSQPIFTTGSRSLPLPQPQPQPVVSHVAGTSVCISYCYSLNLASDDENVFMTGAQYPAYPYTHAPTQNLGEAYSVASTQHPQSPLQAAPLHWRTLHQEKAFGSRAPIVNPHTT